MDSVYWIRLAQNRDEWQALVNMVKKLCKEKKSKVIPRQAEVTLGVPGRLRSWIISTTRVVGRKPYAPAAFNPGEIPVLIFRG